MPEGPQDLEAFLGNSPAGIALRIALVLLPFVAVLRVVWGQNKVVAAFAQLGDAQERSILRKEIAAKALEVDKRWFILGVSNVWLSAYICGAFPLYYYLFYTPKVLSLIVVRLVKFYKKKQHFLLWDFCYWANFLCLFYCWVMPGSPKLFQTVFMCANGPLAWSVLAFNHAMIFHSYAHITSVVVHYSPLLLTYCLRWHANPVGTAVGVAAQFQICETDAQSCLTVSFLELVGGSLVRFYLWWLVLYYVWIFVALGSYIEQRGYQTLWDRILVMKPVGPFLQKLLKKFPKLLVQLVYLLIHLAFSSFTMCVAVVLWHSQIAHLLFVVAIGLATIKNAAEFYMDLLESQHFAAITATEEGRQGSKPTVDKRILAASGALSELAKPLLKSS